MTPSPFDPLPYHGGAYTVPLAASYGQEYVFTASTSDTPCGERTHHIYTATITYTGWPDTDGLGLTGEDLAIVGRWITGTLQDRHLNDVLDVHPTLDALAATILSLALTVLESRAEQGRPVPAHAAAVTVTDEAAATASAHAHLPVLGATA